MTHDPDRFHAGEQWVFDGIRFEIRHGGKKRGDLVIGWETPTGWHPVTADALYFVFDFIAWNEDNLRPYPEKGGAYLQQCLSTARAHGWRSAVARLHEERARADERRSRSLRFFA